MEQTCLHFLSLSLSLSNAHNCVKLSHENSSENKVLPVSVHQSQKTSEVSQQLCSAYEARRNMNKL